MIPVNTLLVCLILSLACLGCAQQSASQSSQPGKAGSVQWQVNKMSSVLDSTSPSLFQVQPVALKSDTNLEAVYFLDELHGWVGGSQKVYRTDDGGKTWDETKLDVPSGGILRDILFEDASNGWITIQKDSSYILDYPEYRVGIMHTSDGGKSWATQLSETLASGIRIAFSDKENGWLVGIKYIRGKGVHFQPLVLRTTNHGENWQDVSANLVQVSSDQNDSFGDPINEGLAGIAVQNHSEAIVMSTNMRLFKTRDGGGTWQQIGSMGNPDQQAGVRRFGLNNGQLWWVAGTDGVEGIRGLLAAGEETGHTWSSSELSGVCFAGAVSIAKGEFIVVGHTRGTKQGGLTGRAGIVLYSDDWGHNWETIYKDQSAGGITGLSVVKREVWAVTDAGVLLHLTPPVVTTRSHN